MRLMMNIVAATAVLWAASSVQQAHADPILYTDRADFLAALGGPGTHENLNSIVTDTEFTNSSTTVGTLTFTSTGGAAGAMLIDVPPGLFSSGTGIDGTAFLNAGGLLSSSTVTITLPSAVTAFGFDTLNFDFGDEQAEVFVSGLSIGTTLPTEGSTGFLGVIDTMNPFTSVEIRAAAGTLAVAAAFDNLVWGDAAPVPEPSTCALFGLVALGYGVYRRRNGA